MEEQSTFEVKNKITPTSHEFEAKAQVPTQTVNEFATVTANCIDTLRKGSERVGKMLSNSANVIGKPIGAWFEGKANEITANSQLIVANITYQKEINAIRHLQYITEEFNHKVDNNEDIPEKIEKSDNLFLIQDNASTTSEEEFLRIWAKLYTEEACKPGTISRKTIKTVETLDSNIIKILEKDILPFCDDNGCFWGVDDKLQSLVLAQDYGIVDKKGIEHFKMSPKAMMNTKLNDEKFLYLYPSYSYSPSGKYFLTNSGLEIKKILKIYANEEQLKEIFYMIEEASKNWQISGFYDEKVYLKSEISNIEKYVICDSENNVIIPDNQPYKTLDDFYNNALANMEINF